MGTTLRNGFGGVRRPLIGCTIALLAAGGCADPRTGRVDVGRSLLLGAGVGALIEDGTRGRRHGRPYLPPVAGPAHGHAAPYGHGRGFGW